MLALLPTTFIVSAEQLTESYQYSDKQLELLDYTNELRKGMGLNEIKLDAILTTEAQNQAESVFNDMNGKSDKSYESFSETIKTERPNTKIGEFVFTETIESFKEKIHHYLFSPSTFDKRFGLVNPNTIAVGIGIKEQYIVVTYERIDRTIYTLATINNIFNYPLPSETNVIPFTYGKVVKPNPLEGLGIDVSGSIITFLSSESDIEKIEKSAYLKDANGNEIEIRIKPAEISALRKMDEKEVHYIWNIIPLKPLMENTTYHYTVSNNTKSFTTGKVNGYYKEIYKAALESSQSEIISQKDNELLSEKEDLPISTIVRGSKDNVSIILNGQIATLNPHAHVLNGSTYIPLRGVFQSAGAKVDWDQSTQTVLINKSNTSLSMKIGEKQAIVNGRKVNLDSPAFIKDGYTFVPLRFISETIGGSVNWDSDNYIANVMIK